MFKLHGFRDYIRKNNDTTASIMYDPFRYYDSVNRNFSSVFGYCPFFKCVQKQRIHAPCQENSRILKNDGSIFLKRRLGSPL